MLYVFCHLLSEFSDINYMQRHLFSLIDLQSESARTCVYKHKCCRCYEEFGKELSVINDETEKMCMLFFLVVHCFFAGACL